MNSAEIISTERRGHKYIVPRSHRAHACVARGGGGAYVLLTAAEQLLREEESLPLVHSAVVPTLTTQQFSSVHQELLVSFFLFLPTLRCAAVGSQ